jgi:peptide/nickel transport system substrate-binding protein
MIGVDAPEERRGPVIDIFRAKVIKNPDAQLLAMQNEEGVVLTDLIRPGDIVKLDAEGFTITSAPGFHMGHIGFNIRPNRDYLTPPYKCNPAAAPFMSDVNFRHALFHLYNQEEIVASIYGYIVLPIQSLVPPAQGGWVNPDVPLHPYNPGDKTGTTVYNPATGENEDACSILRYGGYTYDAGEDNWRNSGGTLVPTITLWTPTYETAPTSADHGARFVATCNTYGVTSIEHVPRDFAPYMDDVDIGDFDMYMVFWSLGRFPDHLETMCHSDHDVAVVPHDYNLPGCHDPDLDAAVRTIITSLDHSEKLAAAYEAQRILYDEDYPNAAFSYMQLYSRIYFNGFNPDLRGIVNSPGYGSANGWTYMNIHWAPGTERLEGGETIVEWIWGEEPELLNPCSATTVYAWDIIDKTLDGMIAVNPYTHEDMPWMATDWDVDVWPDAGGSGVDWMNLTFYLRDDIYWQDGNQYTAEDAEFSLEFLRDNEIPRYMGMWMWLHDVEVLDTYTFRAIMTTTSQFLLYDVAGTAALLPPQVWAPWDGQPLVNIMQYDPSTDTSATGMGPWFGTGSGYASTHLFGTGPFVFEFYNPSLMYSDLHQFKGYFLTTAEIQDMKTEMFHKIGDVNRDGYIDVFDLSTLGVSYGCFSWMPCYNVNADLNLDGVCDGRDLALITWHWGEQKEYPEA